MVIIGNTFELNAPVKTTLVRVADAQGAFAKVLAMYNTIKLDKKGIAPQAVIEPGAAYGDNCYIGPNTVIAKGVTIGAGCIIGAGSLVLSNIQSGQKAYGSPCRTVGPVDRADLTRTPSTGS